MKREGNIKKKMNKKITRNTCKVLKPWIAYISPRSLWRVLQILESYWGEKSAVVVGRKDLPCYI